MAIIDKHEMVSAALVGVRNIHAMATDLRGVGVSIKSNMLAARLDSMRASYNSGIAPLLAAGNAAAINPIVAAFYAGTVPANTYTSLQAVVTALGALNSAYVAIFGGLVFVAYSAESGHAYADVSAASLSSINDEPDAVIAACAPLL